MFESLERRLCLAAELAYAWATGGSGYDTLGDLERDAAGNLYTTDGDRVIKYAPDRTVIWATNLPDAWNIEIDAEGNVYASGDFFVNSLTVAGVSGNIVVPNYGRNDIYVVKLNSDGKALWGHSFGGADDDEPGGIAVDGQGNVFVGGRFKQTATVGSNSFVSQGYADAFIAKINAAGTFEWGRQIGGNSWSAVTTLDVDSAGNLYLTGTYDEGITFLGGGNVTLPDAPYYGAGYLAKMAPNGDFVWARGPYIGGAGIGTTLAIDPAGSLVVVGRYSGAIDIDPGPDSVILPGMESGSGGYDMFVLKLTLDGQLSWAKQIGGEASEFVSRIAIGVNGQIYIAGAYNGTSDFDPSGNQYFMTSQWQDAFVATLDSAGNFIAARGWGGTSVDSANGVAADAEGNVYVSGAFYGNSPVDFDPGIGTLMLTSTYPEDGFIVKLTPPTGSIESRIWNDVNGDGLQDVGEVSLAGAVVELYATPDATVANYNDGLVARAITDTTGNFRVVNLASGYYYIVVRTPVGYAITTPNVLSDDTRDSDMLAIGRTDVFTLAAGEQKTDQDIGLTGNLPDFGFASRAGGAGSESGNKVVTDAAGNIYVLGSFQQTVDFDPGPATFNLTTSSNEPYVAKYTSTGALVWARQFGGFSSIMGVDLAVNSAGEVFVAGHFSSTVDADPDLVVRRNLSSVGGSDIFLVKLDAQGYHLWGKSFGNAGSETVGGIELDAAGNLWLAGSFSGTVDFKFNATDSASLTSDGNTDAFALKINLNSGAVWAKSFGGTSQDTVRDLAVDAQGNVYTTGYFNGTADFDPAAGTTFNLTSAGNSDAFVSKLNADGTLAWAVRHGNTGADQDSLAIAVDSSGNVFTAGGFQGTVNFGGASLTSSGGSDGYIAKRNSLGQLQWIRQFGGTGADLAYGLTVDAAGAAFIAGQYGSSAVFGDTTVSFLLSSSGSTNAFVQKFTGVGLHESIYDLKGETTGRGNSLALNSVSGRMHVTGQFSGTADLNPGIGVFSLGSNGNDAFLAQLIQDNAQPRVTLSANTITENQGVQTIGLVGVANAADETFTLSVVSGPPTFSIANGTLAADSSQLNFEAAQTVQVGIRAIGSTGRVINQLFTIQVLDAFEKPVLATLNNTSVYAGTPLIASGSFTDPDASDSWTATVNYGDGGGVQPLVLANKTFSLSHTYTTAGVYPVTVVVTDAAGLSDTRSLQVTVTLAPMPTVSFVSGNGSGVRGEMLSYKGALTGALPVGTNTVTWNFGDGSPPITLPATGNWQDQQHVFAATGSYSVSLTFTAADGRTTAAVLPVTITAVSLRTDPNDGNYQTLFVGGTERDDVLRVLSREPGRIKVWSRMQLLGSYMDVEKVVVYGQAGNDLILGAVASNVEIVQQGGDGNDLLIGSSGHDALLGDAGNDFLFAGSGRDLVVGGSGSDILIAGNDEDIVIAGDIALSNLEAGLADIRKEWTSARTFVDRVQNLRGDMVGTRDNGNTLLLVAQTVLDDNDHDWLWGGSTNDWFFADDIEDELPDQWFNDAVDYLGN